jgi:hypothetical protein
MSRKQQNESPLFSEPARDEQLQQDNDELLAHAVLRLSGHVLGLVLGILFSLIIFIATNWLVIKGGSVVGPHLSLLSQYFIGYSVSFVGSLIGVLYAFVLGYISGLIIAWVYNQIVAMTADNG